MYIIVKPHGRTETYADIDQRGETDARSQHTHITGNHIKTIVIYIFIILQDFFRVSHWMVLPGILPTYPTCSAIYAVPLWSPTSIQASRLIGFAIYPSDNKQYSVETTATSIIKTSCLVAK